MLIRLSRRVSYAGFMQLCHVDVAVGRLELWNNPPGNEKGLGGSAFRPGRRFRRLMHRRVVPD